MNTGTTEQPWTSRLISKYGEWNATRGEVQMFSRRPASIAPGDILIHRAVGSDGNRLVAVGEAVSPAEPSGHERWPWQIRRRLLHVCSEPHDAPRDSDAGISSRGVRTYKELTAEAGEQAVELITRAGIPWR